MQSLEQMFHSKCFIQVLPKLQPKYLPTSKCFLNHLLHSSNLNWCDDSRLRYVKVSHIRHLVIHVAFFFSMRPPLTPYVFYTTINNNTHQIKHHISILARILTNVYANTSQDPKVCLTYYWICQGTISDNLIAKQSLK